MRRPLLLAAAVVISSFAAACSSPTSPAPSKLRPVDAVMDGVPGDTTGRGHTGTNG